MALAAKALFFDVFGTQVVDGVTNSRCFATAKSAFSSEEENLL
jgi:hypothetical protein